MSASVDETTPLIAEVQNDPGHEGSEHNKVRVLYWKELGTLTRFALPVVGAGLLEFSLPLMSVISIGHISTTALAGSTLGIMTASVTGLSLIQGFASALDTVLPSSWTSSQPELVGIWAQRMGVLIFSALIPMIWIWWNIEPVLLLLKQDPEVARYASLFIQTLSLSLPAYAFNAIGRRYLQAQGLFSVPTRIMMIVAPFNAFLNYLLVWGPEPFRMGFSGAPLATAISMNLIALLTLIYTIFYVPRTAWHPISRRSFMGLGILVRLGCSGIAEVCSDWWAWDLAGLVASMLGPVALAANSIVLICGATAFQIPFAIGVAASVRIGNLLGEKNAQGARVASNTALLMAVAFSAVTSTLFTVFRHSLGYLFNEDPEVIRLLAGIFPIVAAFQLFDGVAGVAGGILRARGMQLTGAVLNLSAYYVLGLPFGTWLAFRHSYGLYGLWIGLTISLIYASVAGSTLCVLADWDREVKKVLERLEKEEEAKRKLQAEGIDC